MADENAAPVTMLKIDGEVRHLPRGLGAAVIEHDKRILNAEPRQVGGIAAPCPFEHVGDRARDVEHLAAGETIVLPLGDPGFGRIGFNRWRAGERLTGVAGSGTRETERKAAAGFVSQQEPRTDEVDAARRKPPGQQRASTHADGGKRRLGKDLAILVDQPHIAQAKQHARSVRRPLQDRVVDLHADIGKLAIDRLLDGGDEAGKRDRTAGEPAITENDGNQSDHQNAGEDFAANMGAARG